MKLSRRYGKFQLVTFSHEPAVGFAADAAARITNGLGVCLVTYGAGGLNMVNSVACAYAEKSPLVVISGGPGMLEKRRGVLVHHEVKSYESQLKVYNEVVEYGAILDNPRTAAAEIRKALDLALQLMRPVYLEVPRDMVFTEIPVPESFEPMRVRIDEGALTEASEEILDRLTTSQHPVLVVGVEAHRFGLQKKIVNSGRAAPNSGGFFLSRARRLSHHTSTVQRYLPGNGKSGAFARDR